MSTFLCSEFNNTTICLKSNYVSLSNLVYLQINYCLNRGSFFFYTSSLVGLSNRKFITEPRRFIPRTTENIMIQNGVIFSFCYSVYVPINCMQCGITVIVMFTVKLRQQWRSINVVGRK